MTLVDLWVEWSRPLGADDAAALAVGGGIVALAWLVDGMRRRRMAETPEKVAIAEQIAAVESARELVECDGELWARSGKAQDLLQQDLRAINAAVATLKWVEANAELLRRVAPMLAVFPEAEAIGVTHGEAS